MDFQCLPSSHCIIIAQIADIRAVAAAAQAVVREVVAMMVVVKAAIAAAQIAI